MDAENRAEATAQECGLIVQQDGKPQRVLAKFLNLMLNYQYGFSTLVAADIPRAVALLNDPRPVRCAFVVQHQESADAAGITALSRQGDIPLFLIIPQARMDRQLEVCAGLDHVYYCAWEKAFGHTPESLQHVAAAALEEHGIGDLLGDIERVPYPVIQQRVERRLRNINTLPTLPEIIMRIMRMVNDPTTITAELEQVLCTDPAIVMKLLQVVRSPVFGGTVQRGGWTLAEIIVRLGLKKVGAIAQQIKLINSLVKPEASDFDLRRFWEHSVGCAIIADKLHTQGNLPFKAEVPFNDYWIGALLHDIGKLVLGFFFWDWFSRVLDRVRSTGTGFRAAEASLGDTANHDRVGQLLLVYANMGPELTAVVGSHHSIGEQPGDLECLVHLANNMAKEIGLGYLPGEKPHYHKAVLDALGITSGTVAALKASLAEDSIDEIKYMVEQCL